MKKFLIVFMALLVFTGCNSKMDNTPTKKVEDYFNKYQTNDSSVLDDLDSTLAADTTITDSNRDEYRNFYKNHYKSLKYEIKDEKVDGSTATVETEVTVKNYTQAISEADDLKSENPDKFNDESGNYDASKFSEYRLEKMKNVNETSTYTITMTLTKQDGEWVINQPSDEDLNKINGLYSE